MDAAPKGPESLHKPKYDFEAPKGFAYVVTLGGSNIFSILL